MSRKTWICAFLGEKLKAITKTRKNITTKGHGIAQINIIQCIFRENQWNN